MANSSTLLGGPAYLGNLANLDTATALANTSPISLTELEMLASMRKQNRRLSVIARIKYWDNDASMLPVTQLRSLMAIEDQLETVIASDKNWFFLHPTGYDQSQFAIDLDYYHASAAETYQRLIDRRQEWADNDTESLLHSAVAFAIFHYGSAIKWALLRSQSPRPAMWTALHLLYRFAEKERFATVPVVLFNPELGKQTTVTALYLRALLLNVLSSGNLSLPQVEIADGWLTKWARQYALDGHYDATLHFLYIDLAAATGLQRCTRPANNADPRNLRYLRLNDLARQITTARNQLREGHTYSGDSALTAFLPGEYAALLGRIEALHDTMLHPEASGIEKRTSYADQLARVQIGIDAILQTLGAPAANRAETLHAAEHWKIHDISATGMGLIVDRVTGDKIVNGEILLIKPDGQEHYHLATLARKLTRPDQNEVLLGVEILSSQAFAITLHCMLDNDPKQTRAFPAIYAPHPSAHGRHDMLVLANGDFIPRQPYATQIQKTLYGLRVNRVIHHQPDWVGLRFEVTSKS